jgi:hypothetical protein
MPIGTTVFLDDVSRGERIALVAAYQRASRWFRERDFATEDAVELLIAAVIGNDEEIMLSVEEVDLASNRLHKLINNPNGEAPEIVAAALKVAERLEGAL